MLHQRGAHTRSRGAPPLRSARPPHPRAPSTPALPRPRSLLAPTGDPLTRMPCSTRTRSSSSIPKDTLRPSLLSAAPIAGGGQTGGHATRLQSNQSDAELSLPGLGLLWHKSTKLRFIGCCWKFGQSCGVGPLGIVGIVVLWACPGLQPGSTGRRGGRGDGRGKRVESEATGAYARRASNGTVSGQYSLWKGRP